MTNDDAGIASIMFSVEMSLSLTDTSDVFTRGSAEKWEISLRRWLEKFIHVFQITQNIDSNRKDQRGFCETKTDNVSRIPIPPFIWMLHGDFLGTKSIRLCSIQSRSCPVRLHGDGGPKPKLLLDDSTEDKAMVLLTNRCSFLERCRFSMSSNFE